MKRKTKIMIWKIGYGQYILENVTLKIIIEARYTVTKLSIKDKIKELGDGGAYLIVKDHREESAKKPLFRLMHPLKSEIGTIETNKHNWQIW